MGDTDNHVTLRSAMSRSSSDDDFDEFAVSAWPRLRRSAYLITGDHHLAEDLAQAALARTYAHRRRVRRDDALAYARRILVNLNIDRIRRRRFTEAGGDSVDHAAAQQPSRADTSVEDHDLVVRLLAVLTARERRVVVLRHYFDLSEADIAAELGIAPGTVKSTLSRALSKLRVSDSATEEAARP
jgi:RNA polymerase sigma-70 factor (sigma-E family)